MSGLIWKDGHYTPKGEQHGTGFGQRVFDQEGQIIRLDKGSV